ncbi:MAG: ROK family protein [Ignavibacteriaceae bacterium]
MGGTKILAALINSNDGIVSRVKKATRSNSTNTEYLNALAEVVNETIETSKINPDNIKAVVLGIPGSVDPYIGRIGLAPNLGIRNFFIKEKLQSIIPYPVLIENDVNLAALGIKKFELSEKSKNVFVVFIGTGIGGALIFNSKIYRGSNYVAGEIGHMQIDKKGPVCGCGRRGCFEAIASRSAIEKKIRAEIKSGRKSIITKLVKPGEKMKSKSLASAVKKNDKIVITQISNACAIIGTVLANTSNLLNFDTIVLGGGLIEALDHFMLPKIKESFNKTVLKDSAKGLKIISTKLGDDAALYGGIVLAEEFLEIDV